MRQRLPKSFFGILRASSCNLEETPQLHDALSWDGAAAYVSQHTFLGYALHTATSDDHTYGILPGLSIFPFSVPVAL